MGEVVSIPFTATIHKLLAEAGLGVVEVPGHHGIAATCYFRLQAEGRLRSCWKERGNGSVMRMSSSSTQSHSHALCKDDSALWTAMCTLLSLPLTPPTTTKRF